MPGQRHDNGAIQTEQTPSGGDLPLFVSHSEASKMLEQESAPCVVQTWGWNEHTSRSEVVRLKRRARIQRRAKRILHEYMALQAEATAAALMHAQRATQGSEGATMAMGCLAAWCEGNTRGAEGLDVPGMRATVHGAFIQVMAEAKGGMVSGPLWGQSLVPERH